MITQITDFLPADESAGPSGFQRGPKQLTNLEWCKAEARRITKKGVRFGIAVRFCSSCAVFTADTKAEEIEIRGKYCK